jgi:hypothetical protein
MILSFAVVVKDFLRGGGETMQANQQIRDEAKTKGIKLWEIAEVYGLSDGNFSRKLRRELPEAEQRKIMDIISRLSKEDEQ